MADNERIVPAKEARAETEEKKSVFIASVCPVSTEEEARSFIERIKKEYYDARHNVFAYILDGGAVSRFTDDGEPKGSAGIPVLNVLKMSGADGICVVVTRYFGGILLGTGGLVRAYSAAAKAALDAAGLVKMEMWETYNILCSYSDYQKLVPRLTSVGAVEENSEFAGEVTLRVSCREADSGLVKDTVVQVTNGRARAVLEEKSERPGKSV